MGTRREFSKEFREEAVRRSNVKGVNKQELALELGIHDSVLQRWRREAKKTALAQPSNNAVTTYKPRAAPANDNAELVRLRAEVKHLKKLLAHYIATED